MATTTPANASDAYKEQIRDIVTPNIYPSNKIALLGDSITARNHLSNGGLVSADFKGSPSTGVMDATHNKFEYNGWFHWANAFLYQRFEVVSYAGVPGHTNAQMYARLQTDVVAFNPDYCFVQVSANGIAAGLTGVAELSSVQSIVNDLLGAGIIPIVSRMVYSGSVSNGAESDQWMELNHDLMQWLRAKGVIAVDLQKGMGDVFSKGDVRLHADYSGDNVHPNVNGAIRMGKNCYDQLKNIIPESNILPAWSSDYKTGVRNPLQEKTGGTVTGAGASGVVSDFWKLVATASGTETVTGAKVARSGIEAGECVELTFGGTPADITESFEYSPNSVTMTNSGFVTGDTISMYVEMEIITAIGNMQPPHIRGFFSADSQIPTFEKAQLNGVLDGDVVGMPFLMRLPDTVLGTTVGTDTGVILIELYPDTVAAISGVLKIGSVWMQKKIT